MNKILASVNKRMEAVVAAYTGTKSSDLIMYINGLVPALRLPKNRPAQVGGGSFNPAERVHHIKITDAHVLGAALIKAGWDGKKRSFKTKNAAGDTVTVEYIEYTLQDDSFKFFPVVRLFKPAKGADKTRVKICHNTAAALKEERVLFDLNRRMQKMSRPPEKKIRRGGGGGPGFGFGSGGGGRTGGVGGVGGGGRGR